ncbi:hypothetical protein [Rhizobium sp. BK176]|uniref:hypothetical protein n=1 Tax=Rhizobium sp. BK176 TaxID=2587071 RepID=UPI00216A6229|nr:hypothetical protein [Rhizobium sp. BK176]MCS4094656.1 hypothetical protein [Rhizobium sp. BK176]
MSRAAVDILLNASGAPNTHPQASRALISRQYFFAALVSIGFLNGISEKAYRSVADNGLATAASLTFDISVILWGACAVALIALVRAPGNPLRRGDYAIGLLAGLTFLSPVPAMSWLGLCLIAIQLRSTASDMIMRRSAALVFALTIPLFWARLIFAAFNDTILHIDAQLVGWLIGTAATGNVVAFSDGSGSMFIAPGCSSMANLSLAAVSATVFVNLRSGVWSASTLAWTATSLIAVVAINLTRIGLIGIYPQQFDLLHGPVGATVAGCLTLFAIVSIGYHRIGQDAPYNR